MLAAGALMYASCRHLKLGAAWAAGAIFALFLSPFFLYSALQPMSDLLATTWALAALYAAMRSRERGFWALLCGAGVWHCSARPSHQRSISVADPGGIGISSFSACRRQPSAPLPAGLFILYLNFRLYGSALTTGYGSPIQILQAVHSDPTQQFSIFYLRPHLTNFAYWIVLYLGPLVISALALPFFRHARNA